MIEHMRDTLLWMVPLAVALDLFLRYPSLPFLPHPVQLVGAWLNSLEPRLRALAPALERTEGYLPDVLCNGEIRAGFLGVFLTLLLTSAVAAALLSFPFIGLLCAVFLCWSGLALGALLRAGRQALDALTALDALNTLDIQPHAAARFALPDAMPLAYAEALDKARFLLGQLVSRDVSQASPAELYRALAESLAENFNDAFVAPLFWLCVGGPVALWAYKAVSTMDSMWGYRTDRWENFGKCAARLDDVLAFVPARVSAFLLWGTSLCGYVGEGGRWPGVAVVRRQAGRMESPNAGWPMSAAAWLHGARMGGPTVYHGEVVEKPYLGPEGGSPESSGAGKAVGSANSVLWDATRVSSLMRHLLCAGLAGGAMALTAVWVVVLL